MKLAVTGATGYIGQQFIRIALLAGHEVLALSRRTVMLPSVSWQYFELDDKTQVNLPRDVKVVFHLAADTQNAHGSEKSELVAAERMIIASLSIGADFVFVSSQTARADAPTGYGRIKWQIECMTLAANGRVVRPGLVYGGPEFGLYGSLCKIVRRLPILPNFIPSPHVQPVHVNDLAEALLAYHKLAPSSVVCIGALNPMKFTKFLQAIAQSQEKRHLISLPIPISLIRYTSIVLGARLSGEFKLDRLQSLITLPLMDMSQDCNKLFINLRNMEVEIDKIPIKKQLNNNESRRRELLFEAYVLLIYILRLPPENDLMRRYVKAIEKFRIDKALKLSKVFFLAPAMFGLIDGAKCIDGEFQKEFNWRLQTALILAEASPQGAQRFLGLNRKKNTLQSVLCILRAILFESVRRFSQIILYPLLRYVGLRGIYK